MLRISYLQNLKNDIFDVQKNMVNSSVHTVVFDTFKGQIRIFLCTFKGQAQSYIWTLRVKMDMSLSLLKMSNADHK